MTLTPKSVVDKCLKDKEGKVVITQFPNLPLTVWLLSVIIIYFLPELSVKQGVLDVGSAFLFVWAYLEITQGASYFRRALGAIVLVAIILKYFMT